VGERSRTLYRIPRNYGLGVGSVKGVSSSSGHGVFEKNLNREGGKGWTGSVGWKEELRQSGKFLGRIRKTYNTKGRETNRFYQNGSGFSQEVEEEV